MVIPKEVIFLGETYFAALIEKKGIYYNLVTAQLEMQSLREVEEQVGILIS